MPRSPSRVVSKAAPVPQETARQLARALSALAGDLVNPYDESTDEFTPFSAPLDQEKTSGEPALRAALSISGRYELVTRPMDPDAFAEWGEPYVSSYAVLWKVMSATLTDLQVVWARRPGVVRVRCWFVGRLGTGWLVGLRTMSTET